MQTFLPYASFAASLACLDNKRLGKQRVEAMQIVNALTNPTYGWQNHPAVNMWRGHVDLLKLYHNLAIREWVSRGFKNTMALYVLPDDFGPEPSWMGNEAFHASHRSNLLRKDPVFYGRYGWTEPHDLPYIWPTKEAA